MSAINGVRAGHMVCLTWMSYKGQPIYRQYSATKSHCWIFSREIEVPPKSKCWKFVRWVPLKDVKLDLRRGNRSRLRTLELAYLEVQQMPGVSVKDPTR